MYKICICGKKFFKKVSDSRKYWAVKRYCSIKCSGTLIKRGEIKSPGTCIRSDMVGDKALNFKGGRNQTPKGYIRILKVGTCSYDLEHRLVMELKLGRKLVPGEVVHHINGIKCDNRPENLELLKKRDHDRLETTRRWRSRDKPFRRNII